MGSQILEQMSKRREAQGRFPLRSLTSPLMLPGEVSAFTILPVICRQQALWNKASLREFGKHLQC